MILSSRIQWPRPHSANKPKALAALALGMALGGPLISGQAYAAGFANNEQSAVDIGAANAGATARADDPSTLFFNPAGMALLPGVQIAGSSQFIDVTADVENARGTRSTILGGGAISGTTSDNGGSTSYVPSLYATVQLAPEWHLGLAITSPYGLTTKYSDLFAGRYYALTSELQTINVAPSVAYQPWPGLSIGAALQIESANAHLSNAVDFGSIGALEGLGMLGLLPGSSDGTATLRGSNVSFGWQFGVLYEPVSGTHLGLGYRSAVYHNLSGSVSYQGVPASLAGAFPNEAASAKLVEPNVVELGISHDIGSFKLLAGVTWTEWSQFKDLLAVYSGGSSLIQANWKNSWAFSAGIEYRLANEFTVRAGTGYEPTPVSAGFHNPASPDANIVRLSLGATWQPNSRLALSVAYAHLFPGNTKIDLSDDGPGTANFLRGNLQGTLVGNVDLVSIQATMKF